MPVGKLTFSRDLMGRMVNERSLIRDTKVSTLDFEEQGELFSARCRGTEQQVKAAIDVMLEIADVCGFIPGNDSW